jgi:hypothetical protein
MTRKLEELFDLPPSGCESETTEPETVSTTQNQIKEIDNTIDKIDQALPAVKGLDASDAEMDDIASKAQETFDNLMICWYGFFSFVTRDLTRHFG